MLYRSFLKRALDIILSGAAICLLSPLMILTALLVRINLGTPVIFTQDRPGRNEKIFRLYKFRTMTDAKDPAGRLLPDEERLTKFGRVLRKTSIDELPELFNIFKGDMSIVGPRPLLTRYLPYYTEEERLRHSVRPGLTGLAQVNGRNTVGWDERLRYDVQYSGNITFLGDVKIIIKTVWKVLRGSDVATVGQFSMEDLDVERGKCKP